MFSLALLECELQEGRDGVRLIHLGNPAPRAVHGTRIVHLHDIHDATVRTWNKCAEGFLTK